jgi:hypothetical protein
MRLTRIILYALYLAYFIVTTYMGMNIDKMISKYGLFSFFSFFKDWLMYGLVFLWALLIADSLQIWLMHRTIRKMKNEFNERTLNLIPPDEKPGQDSRPA